jgi:hypothetical protein
LCNPQFILLPVHPTVLDDAQADVNDVNVVHLETSAAGVGGAGKEAKDEGIEPVGQVPVGGHALAVHFTVLGHYLAILVDKPEEEVYKDNVGLTKATLLEGSVHLCQEGLEKEVGEGGVHRDNVCPRFLVTRMRCTDCGAVIFVGAPDEVGDIGNFGQEGRKGIGVCLQ